MTRLTDAVQGLRQQFASPPAAHGHAAGSTVPFQMPVPRPAVPVPIRPMGAAAMTTGGLGFTPPGLSVTGGVGVAPPQPPTPPAVPPAAAVAMDPGRLAVARQIFYSKALAKQASRARVAKRDLEELRSILGESESDLYKAVAGKVGKGIPDEGTLRMMRERFGIEFPTTTDLPGDIVRGLLGKQQAGHRIDQDLLFKLLIGGSRDKLPLPQKEMENLWKAASGGKKLPVPSQKMVKAFAAALNLPQLLPREWFKPPEGGGCRR